MKAIIIEMIDSASTVSLLIDVLFYVIKLFLFLIPGRPLTLSLELGSMGDSLPLTVDEKPRLMPKLNHQPSVS